MKYHPEFEDFEDFQVVGLTKVGYFVDYDISESTRGPARTEHSPHGVVGKLADGLATMV